MNADQVDRCRAIANGIKARGGTPTELALLFLIEHIEVQLAAAERRAGEKDAEARDTRRIFLESYDVGIMCFPTEATAGAHSRDWRARWMHVFMQAQEESRSERDAQTPEATPPVWTLEQQEAETDRIKQQLGRLA